MTAAAAAAGTAAAQAGPVQGCVLPATDAVAVAPPPEVAPAIATRGPSLVAPLLLGLDGLVAVFGLLQLLKNDDGTAHPISPQ